MSTLLPEIRKQLRVAHGLLKHGETPAEIATAERLAPLHDQILGFEAQVVVIGVEQARELLSKGVGLSKETVANVGESIAAADERAAKIAQQSAEQQARANNAAAKAALATPATPPAPPPVSPTGNSTETAPATTS